MDRKKFIKFANLVGKLKNTHRVGWIDRNVKDPESVADHTFRTSVLAMVLADMWKLDVEKVMKMALLHELGEIVVGDKRPWEKDEKKEFEGIKTVLSFLPRKLRKEYLKILEEFVENKTFESQLVNQIDKLELIIQAKEYERKYCKKFKRIVEFAETYIKDSNLLDVLNQMKKKG